MCITVSIVILNLNIFKDGTRAEFWSLHKVYIYVYPFLAKVDLMFLLLHPTFSLGSGEEWKPKKL